MSTRPPAPPAAKFGAPLVVLAAIGFVSSLGVAVMLPLIPLYALSLRATPLQLGLLTSGFSVASAAAQFGAGVYLDRYGARAFISGGIATYAAANVLIATSASAGALIAFRSLAGLGGGVNVVATRLYLAQIAHPAHLAFTNGVLSAATSAGQVIGPALGGLLASWTNLRVPFLVVGATSGAAFLASLLLPRPGHVPSPGGDGAGAVLTRPAAVLLATQLFLNAGYGAWITTFAPFATAVLGWTTSEVGFVFAAFGVGSIGLGPALGWLADRVGHRHVALLSLLPVALALVVLAAGLPRAAIYAAMLLAGAGITGYSASWFALLAAASPEARRGRTFGVVNAVATLGVVAGAMAASTVWERAGLSAGLLSAIVPVALSGAALLLLPRRAAPGP